MKKVIVILSIAFTFASCTTDSTETNEIPNCNCWTVVSNDVYNVLNYTYHVNRLKNDCTGELRTQESNLVMWSKVCN